MAKGKLFVISGPSGAGKGYYIVKKSIVDSERDDKNVRFDDDEEPA